MKKPDYGYQKSLVDDVVNHFANGAEIVVLAGAPGAGKTKMALEIYEKLNEKTLVLAHGTHLIRQHWSDRSTKYKPAILEVGFKKSQLRKNLLISIPQTIVRKIKNTKVGLLIVDEGHERYLASEVQSIVAETQPTYTLVLTGSPQAFLKNPKYEVVGISAQELLEHKVISDPVLKIIEAPFDLPFSKYNQELLVKREVKFSSKETQQAVQLSLDYLKEKTDRIGKTMIVCHNQIQAVDVFNYLTQTGKDVVLSISNVSDGISELREFCEGDAKYFIVVHRGILGFDYPALENVIDMSGTLNPYRLFQLFCRLVRPNGRKKTFLKLTDTNMAAVTYVMMNFAVALSHPKYYFSLFTPRRTNIPVPSSFNPLNFDLSTAEIFTMDDVKDLKLLATTTLYQVRRKIQAKSNEKSFFDIIEFAKLCTGRKDFRKKYPNCYRQLEKNGMLHLLDAIHPKRKEIAWRDQTLEENIRIIKGLIEDKGYKNMYQFRINHSGAHKYLQKMGALDKINIEPAFTKWTLKSALAEAKKHRLISQFNRAHPGAYEFLLRIGAMPSFEHSKYAKKWDEKAVIKVANKCRNLRDLREKYYGAYKFLRRHPEVKVPHFKRNAHVFKGKRYFTIEQRKTENRA